MGAGSREGCVVPLLQHASGVESGLLDRTHEVLDHGVTLCDDADSQVVLFDELPDHSRPGKGLARPGRALNGEVGVVQSENESTMSSACSAADEARTIPGPRGPSQQQVTNKAVGMSRHARGCLRLGSYACFSIVSVR